MSTKILRSRWATKPSTLEPVNSLTRKGGALIERPPYLYPELSGYFFTGAFSVCFLFMMVCCSPVSHSPLAGTRQALLPLAIRHSGQALSEASSTINGNLIKLVRFHLVGPL